MTKVESSFSFEDLKRDELKSLASVQTQCEKSTEACFETFDFRKCLCCGHNDKTAGACIFHPAMPKFAGGAGNLIYSSEWHQCREKCAKGDVDSGCREQSKHFYGVHLPYEPGTRDKRTLQKPRAVAISETADKETMTEISLMFNPFKSELKERQPVQPIQKLVLETTNELQAVEERNVSPSTTVEPEQTTPAITPRVK